jgi:hypothetical protein
MRTIDDGIKKARERGEYGLNIPFGCGQVIGLSETLRLNRDKQSYIDLRNAVAVSLGFEPWVTNRERLTIDQRLDSRHYRKDNLQFRIEHVLRICSEFGIDQRKRPRMDVAEAILGKVLGDRRN